MKTITLATLPQATEQQVFNQVASHLLKQGKRCLSTNGLCRYRNLDEGTACAAGCLISEEEYLKRQTKDGKSNHFEANGAWRSLVDSMIVPEEHANLIMKLQIIHDKYKPHEWLDQLISLAKTMDFSVTEIQTQNEN